jgi:hypothetical protein
VTNGTDAFPKHYEVHVCHAELSHPFWAAVIIGERPCVDGTKDYEIVTKSREQLELLSRILMENIFECEGM